MEHDPKPSLPSSQSGVFTPPGFRHRTPNATAPLLSQSDFPWPHAPPHRLTANGTYFVTAGTLHKAHHFRTPSRLDYLTRELLSRAVRFGWRFEAWAVFSNHYHFVAHTPEGAQDGKNLSTMLNQLHEDTAVWVNRRDGARGRKVWFNFRETLLSFHNSYLARLNYTHQNAVKHGLVKKAEDYPWCSAGWFNSVSTSAHRRTIESFKIDRVSVYDEYEPLLEAESDLERGGEDTALTREATDSRPSETQVGTQDPSDYGF
jgi:putative transposase